MVSALLVLFDDVEEIEAITVIDLLRRAGVILTVAGVGKKQVTGSHKIKIEADTTFQDAAREIYDAIILPGGPGTASLNSVTGLHSLLRNYKDMGKVIGAICAAPTVLSAAGVLMGKRATCYPGLEPKLNGSYLVKQPVVEDGRIITSRGAGTAIPFAFALITTLVSKAKADEIARSIVYGA